MSDPADAPDLRRLVDRAVALEAPSMSKRHPILGIEVPRKNSYAHPAGRVPLPTVEAGLRHIRDAFTSPILELDEPERLSAWQALLREPGLVIPLSVPSREELLEAGVVVPASVEMARVRRVGLAVVARPSIEDISEGYLASGRLAGVARLTVLMRPGVISAEDAWIHARWVNSTDQLGQQLEELVRVATPAVRGRSARTSLTVVVGTASDAYLDPAQVSKLERIALVHGMKLTIVRRHSVTYGHVREALRTTPPRYLVVVGQADAECLDLLQVHRSAVETARQRLVDLSDSPDPASELRSVLTAFAGVSPGLYLMGTPPALILERKPPMPAADPGRCMHDPSERIYVEDKSTKLWWTRDTAGHADAVFKTYRLENKTLIHDACRDADGGVIDKWKGEVGRTIALKGLHACGTGPHTG